MGSGSVLYSLMFGALTIKVQRVARIFYGVKQDLHYTPCFATPIYRIILTLTVVTIQMNHIPGFASPQDSEHIAL